MRRPTIVYAYPHTKWADYPGRQIELTKAMSEYARLVFLEINPSNGWSIQPRAGLVLDGVEIVHNAMRLRTSRFGRGNAVRLAAAFDGRWLQSVLRSMGVDDGYIYWVASNDLRLLRGMHLNRLVYDCIDPCFDDSMRQKFDYQEAKLASQAKVVICTAELLAERMLMHNPVVHLIPNAAPIGAVLQPSDVEVPEVLCGRGPVAGYLGTIDARFDFDLILRSAISMPEMTFCIAGRINREHEDDMAQIRALPNVVVTGPVSRADGERLVAYFDVGLIPFKCGEVCDAINPVKMYMYLKSGIPVVASDIRECRGRKPLVSTARTVSEFVGCLRDALIEVPEIAFRRRVYAEEQTWSNRASEVMHLLEKSNLLDAC